MWTACFLWKELAGSIWILIPVGGLHLQFLSSLYQALCDKHGSMDFRLTCLASLTSSSLFRHKALQTLSNDSTIMKWKHVGWSGVSWDCSLAVT